MPAYQKVFALHNTMLPLLLVASSQAAFGQPTAGSQLQQIPTPPQQARSAPAIRVLSGTAPAAALTDTTTVLVKGLRVSAPVFSEAELIAASGVVAGSEMTLSQLRAAAARITEYFNARGYFLAQAYLPAQDISDGMVQIAVLPGQYGKITLRNSSAMADSRVAAIIDGLEGATITTAPLERRLLLLSDLPGVQVGSTLAPGASTGASDLIVEMTPGARFNGSIDADNQGNRYTGKNRLGMTINANQLAGLGDVASLRAFRSDDHLNYARAAWQAQAGLATLGVAATYMDYRLGKEFASLDANGNARIGSLFGSYPLLRSRNANVRVLLGYDAKTFRDRADSTGSVTDKRAKTLALTLQGDVRDAASGAAANLALAVTSGKIDITSPAALLNDSLSAKTDGNFHKVLLNASGQRPLFGATSVYAMASAQAASGNLDISEKLGIGGVGGVRAYPGGEAYGDQGYVVNLELRQMLADQVQLLAFADAGRVTLNRDPWTTGVNRRSLRGAGVGLNWNSGGGLALRVSYAHKLGNEKATSAPDRSGRLWMQAVKYF